MKIGEFVTHLEGVKTTPKGYVACCPAHDDRHPSLVVTETTDKLLIHCWAGCRSCDVLAAMGLDYPTFSLITAKQKERHLAQADVNRNPSHAMTGIGVRRAPSWNGPSKPNVNTMKRYSPPRGGLDINQLTPEQFDEVMTYVGRAYSWLDCCERLDDTLYLLQGTLTRRRAASRAGEKTK